MHGIGSSWRYLPVESGTRLLQCTAHLPFNHLITVGKHRLRRSVQIAQLC
jgi:hypothetical protein